MDTKEKKLSDVLLSMLKKNTGKHFLDSGSTYGRNWERNQEKPDSEFLESPEVYIDSDYRKNDDDYIPELWDITRDVFQYLNRVLGISEESERLNNIMQWIFNRSDDQYYQDIEKFIELLESKDSVNGIYCDNTYNQENILSQNFLYTFFGFRGMEYVIIQIHNGCDIRGGYTRPYLFETNTDDFFYWDFIGLYCKNCEYSEYDSYSEWHYTLEDSDQKLICPNCGKLLSASSI